MSHLARFSEISPRELSLRTLSALVRPLLCLTRIQEFLDRVPFEVTRGDAWMFDGPRGPGVEGSGVVTRRIESQGAGGSAFHAREVPLAHEEPGVLGVESHSVGIGREAGLEFGSDDGPIVSELCAQRSAIGAHVRVFAVEQDAIGGGQRLRVPARALQIERAIAIRAAEQPAQARIRVGVRLGCLRDLLLRVAGAAPAPAEQGLVARPDSVVCRVRVRRRSGRSRADNVRSDNSRGEISVRGVRVIEFPRITRVTSPRGRAWIRTTLGLMGSPGDRITRVTSRADLTISNSSQNQ